MASQSFSLVSWRLDLQKIIIYCYFDEGGKLFQWKRRQCRRSVKKNTTTQDDRNKRQIISYNLEEEGKI